MMMQIHENLKKKNTQEVMYRAGKCGSPSFTKG